MANYILGGALPDGFAVKPKYIGDRRLMEVAISTLALDQGALLVGVPVTAKSVVSEHLSAAISGTSRLVVQGTAGTAEEHIRYGWNYALLLAKGPSMAAVVPSPLMRAMAEGKIARVEELTRIPAETQDSLISILSDKTLPIPELDQEIFARKGFSVIATANNRDRGVNEMSSALRRRFNTIVLPPPKTIEDEILIVESRIADLRTNLKIPCEKPGAEHIRRVVTIFRELRQGETEDRKSRLKVPSGTLSTAEAISVIGNGMVLAGHFGDGHLTARDLASGLTGSVVKDPENDTAIWREYLETVAKSRDTGWRDIYRAARELV